MSSTVSTTSASWAEKWPEDTGSVLRAKMTAHSAVAMPARRKSRMWGMPWTYNTSSKADSSAHIRSSGSSGHNITTGGMRLRYVDRSGATRYLQHGTRPLVGRLGRHSAHLTRRRTASRRHLCRPQRCGP